MKNKPSLIVQITIAIILAVPVGGLFPSFGTAVALVGALFLNALMMLVLPLVIFSLMRGITELSRHHTLGRLACVTFVYYLSTTAISVFIGLVMVNLIAPGKGIYSGARVETLAYQLSGNNFTTVTLAEPLWPPSQTLPNRFSLHLLDQGVRGVIISQKRERVTVKRWLPTGKDSQAIVKVVTHDGEDLLLAIEEDGVKPVHLKLQTTGKGVAVERYQSAKWHQKSRQSTIQTLKEMLLGNKSQHKEGLIPRNIFQALLNVELIPLIFVAILSSLALNTMGTRAEPLVKLIETLDELVMTLVRWVMLTAPLGIFGLVAGRIGQAGGFVGFFPELKSLTMYAMTVLLGLGVHGLVVLPLLLKIVGKRNSITYCRGVMPALLNAFSTASSSATLPLTMEGVIEENKISNKVGSFVLSLGATVNMDGTALYEAVAALFIAQSYGISLSFGQQVIVFFTATLAAIGAAGIPEAGLVTMVLVLRAVGLPLDGIALIVTIDWLLDRFRTTVNVWGDSVGAAVIEETIATHR